MAAGACRPDWSAAGAGQKGTLAGHACSACSSQHAAALRKQPTMLPTALLALHSHACRTPLHAGGAATGMTASQAWRPRQHWTWTPQMGPPASWSLRPPTGTPWPSGGGLASCANEMAAAPMPACCTGHLTLRRTATPPARWRPSPASCAAQHLAVCCPPAPPHAQLAGAVWAGGPHLLPGARVHRVWWRLLGVLKEGGRLQGSRSGTSPDQPQLVPLIGFPCPRRPSTPAGPAALDNSYIIADSVALATAFFESRLGGDRRAAEGAAAAGVHACGRPKILSVTCQLASAARTACLSGWPASQLKTPATAVTAAPLCRSAEDLAFAWAQSRPAAHLTMEYKGAPIAVA